MGKKVNYTITTDTLGTLNALAGQFSGSIPRFIIEAIENSLDYLPSSKRTEVRIQTQRGAIIINDKSAGMAPAELKSEFLCVNVVKNRKTGSRNLFGNGVKGAAFSISDTIRLQTEKGGTRSEILMRKGSVSVVGTESPCDKRLHGTTISVRPHQKIPDDKTMELIVKSAIRYKLNDHRAFLNSKRLTYQPVRTKISKAYKAPSEIAGLIGQGILTLCYFPGDNCPREFRGVAFILGRNVQEQNYTGSIGGMPIARNIAGEFVAKASFSNDSLNRPAVTQDRRGLNSDHDGVQLLKSWVDTCMLEFSETVSKTHKKNETDKQQQEIKRHCSKIEKSVNDVLRKFLEETPAPLIGGVPPGPVLSKKKGGKKAIQPGGGQRAEDSEDGITVLANGHKGAGGVKGNKTTTPSERRANIIKEGWRAKVKNVVSKGGLKVVALPLGKKFGRVYFNPQLSEIQVNLDDSVLSGTGKDTLVRQRTIEEMVTGELSLHCAEWWAMSQPMMEKSMRDMAKDHNAVVRQWQQVIAANLTSNLKAG